MKYLFSIITALLLTNCVSTQSTLKNVDNNAVRPAVKDKAYVITEYATDNKYGYDQDYPINIGFIHEKQEDINIEYEDGYLMLAAEKSEEKEDENKNYLRKERYSTSFKRQFYLGNIKEDQIKASFNDGTLKVIAPKQEEVSNKKQISIE